MGMRRDEGPPLLPRRRHLESSRFQLDNSVQTSCNLGAFIGFARREHDEIRPLTTCNQQMANRKLNVCIQATSNPAANVLIADRLQLWSVEAPHVDGPGRPTRSDPVAVPVFIGRRRSTHISKMSSRAPCPQTPDLECPTKPAAMPAVLHRNAPSAFFAPRRII